MARIPTAIINEVKHRADAVSIIGQQVRLEPSGTNFKGLCPFHSEKTASFYVYPQTSSYYCYGCKASGSVIDFVMEMENIPFLDVVVRLAKMTGVQLPRFEGDATASEFDHLYTLLERASIYFQHCLNEAPRNSPVKRYLHARALSDEVSSRYRVGYAPEGWDNLKNHLSDANEQDMLDVGLTRLHVETKRTYDSFRNRLVFPIRNLPGKVIGFGGRVINVEDKPKYLNSPKSPVFDKGSELYGFHEAATQARRIECLLIVEGYMDVLALAQYGIDYAVATLGTATSMNHFESMFRRSKKVVCCFDGDEAGRNAAWSALTRVLGALKDERDIRFMFLPEGHDPDTFVRQFGRNEFETQLDNAIHVADFLVQRLASGKEGLSVHERVRFVEEVMKLIMLVPHETMRTALRQEVGARFPETQGRLNALLNERLHVPAPVERKRTSTPDPSQIVDLPTRLHMQYLFHSVNVWQYLPELEQERDQLEAARPNNPLIEMWDRIVKLNVKTTSSLVATYQGKKGPAWVEQIAKEPIQPVSSAEFRNGIHTLITNWTYPKLNEDSAEQVQRLRRKSE